MAKRESHKASLQAMPSIDAILQTDVAAELERDLGRERTLSVIRSVADNVRRELEEHGGNGSRDSIVARIEDRLKAEIAVRNKRRLQHVINATGVIIHTNLGRSPLSLTAVEAIVSEAVGYCNLEYDLTTGERGRRGASAESLLADIVGAEDAVIVNNCAAAAFLVLSEFAAGGEVIVSRGELVEIGGDFRIPDVLERSGARLREVGTTNRTKISDYERAISEDTKMILRVHTSNFRIVGFTQTPELTDLAKLSKERGLIFFEDAGSGALVDLSGFGLVNEPVISDSIKAGADIVSFSGDKLAGSTQAGLIVGRAELIRRLRRNPLYRALRPDKLSYAAVEATLNSFATGAALEAVPVLRMLSMTAEEIEQRAERIVRELSGRTAGFLKLELVPGASAVGGGAAPDAELPTCLIAATHSNLSAESLGERLRHFDPPIITRIVDDRLLIDLRTVPESDEAKLMSGLSSISV